MRRLLIFTLKISLSFLSCSLLSQEPNFDFENSFTKNVCHRRHYVFYFLGNIGGSLTKSAMKIFEKIIFFLLENCFWQLFLIQLTIFFNFFAMLTLHLSDISNRVRILLFKKIVFCFLCLKIIFRKFLSHFPLQFSFFNFSTFLITFFGKFAWWIAFFLAIFFL